MKRGAFTVLALDGYFQSISADTVSDLSVLPAQNATGDRVKGMLRTPVRIAIHECYPRALIDGLSAKIEADVERVGSGHGHR